MFFCDFLTPWKSLDDPGLLAEPMTMWETDWRSFLITLLRCFFSVVARCLHSGTICLTNRWKRASFVFPNSLDRAS